MKLRMTINNGGDTQAAAVFEHANKIVVKHQTYNFTCADNSTVKTYEFDTVCGFEKWLENQDWVNPKKTRKVSRFINVPMFHECKD